MTGGVLVPDVPGSYIVRASCAGFETSYGVVVFHPTFAKLRPQLHALVHRMDDNTNLLVERFFLRPIQAGRATGEQGRCCTRVDNRLDSFHCMSLERMPGRGFRL